MKLKSIVPALLAVACSTAFAADTRVDMKIATEKGAGASVGHVTVSETKHGLVFTPQLTGLPAGVHGFHVHENASCDPQEKDGKMVPAQAAGAHYDPAGTKRHGTPWGDGHLGDLPALYVAADGSATNPVLAPRLKMADLKGRALMVHAGGDNHSDHPAALGGGGARIACGVIR
ncbi:superoxide dismutase [Cu-Zn] SodC [Pseudoduganella sp. GCM10020061]|uniref:superoxide dismutase [Cu-Zn] SodC n=1 Tax=Pseudoduganella sp. GCM10020061 TaxID=3317345 RepID=UPI003632B038